MGETRFQGQFWVVFLLSAALFAAPCAGQTITIDANGPADFRNIQAAIDDANDGDTVEVQPGIYSSLGNRDIDFFGKAITVTGIDPNDPNTVGQTIGGCNSQGHDCYPRSTQDTNSILRALTIAHSNASSSENGSAFYSKLLITNRTMSRNTNSQRE